MRWFSLCSHYIGPYVCQLYRHTTTNGELLTVQTPSYQWQLVYHGPHVCLRALRAQTTTPDDDIVAVRIIAVTNAVCYAVVQ